MSGAAALFGVAALVVPAVPAGAASGDRPPPPSPGELIPGQRTATPALVEGIREPAPDAPDAAAAARAHLAERDDRYRIAAPLRDLKPAGTLTTDDGHETVRLRQEHRGVPVLGGQYVVRMEKRDGERVVTGTSGRYFTGLRADTTAAGVDDALAVERAVDAVLSELGAEDFAAYGEGGEDEESPFTGTSHGLVVLPSGTGVLTRHITVRGANPAGGEPVLREVYIDARAGYPVLQYSGIKTFGAPGSNAGSNAGTNAAAAVGAGKRSAADAAGSGVRLDGRAVDLEVTLDEASGTHVLRDRSRVDEETGRPVLSTWDARGRQVTDVAGVWPDGLAEFASPTPEFGAEATEAGAVDAHWAAGQVFDWFKARHGRDSLDGRGMSVDSLVGVTDYGEPYVNAFWDGAKMVYGTGDAEYRPLSAGLDVVGHEMTHGVVDHSADLVYAGQSGALNEAIADYFGNAIETDVHGVPMDDPQAGLLGERLCRTKAPAECAFRDLNDGRTTAKSFLGVGFGTDNGGVHLNSTIFSGALWDIREDLGAGLADQVVYKALTEYLTPLDGFTQGRDAVVAAAGALGVEGQDLNAVRRAFNAHGIVANWELALGVDSDLLLERVNTTDSRLGAGGDWWVASSSDEAGTEAYSVWAGRTDGTGRLKLMSPNDGRYHVDPATDGKTVVWAAYGSGPVEVLARPLAGGPVRKLWSGRGVGTSIAVEGDTVAFEHHNHGGRRGVTYLSLKDPAGKVSVGGGTYRRASFPSLSDGRVVYQDYRRVRATYEYSTRVIDVATGEDTPLHRSETTTSLGPTAVNGRYAYWLANEVRDDGRTLLRRSALDGSGVVDLSPETGPDSLNVSHVTASEATVTAVARTGDTAVRNESLAKLWQFTGAAGARVRVSCNRGEQLSAAAATGSRVVWLDATTGIGHVVTRARPTGTCG
ncbi:M4 family metallopeptidase [Streptomyces griseiscabiei]|uniref:M4 family metallopeptidase n=1 Tax=Streptomyces griseiscabiei TaxID=2993540 RepID=A0ABU4L5V7_9ACTN|nr:M4 family metallopeptidase [Streptomyces griseiscabiei]MDX2911126.1 M4 family metallopeptidase [Streptomyces griseiscabiei]